MDIFCVRSPWQPEVCQHKSVVHDLKCCYWICRLRSQGARRHILLRCGLAWGTVSGFINCRGISKMYSVVCLCSPWLILLFFLKTVAAVQQHHSTEKDPNGIGVSDRLRNQSHKIWTSKGSKITPKVIVMTHDHLQFSPRRQSLLVKVDKNPPTPPYATCQIELEGKAGLGFGLETGVGLPSGFAVIDKAAAISEGGCVCVSKAKSWHGRTGGWGGGCFPFIQIMSNSAESRQTQSSWN